MLGNFSNFSLNDFKVPLFEEVKFFLKSIQFIESNLKKEIDVLTVAREVCYSLYHFIRLFQSITGYSPKNYIQQRRLTEAFTEIKNSEQKIVDIAYDFQFGSPEAFSRAFKKQFKINPSAIRTGVSFTSLQLVSAITADYIYQSDKVRCMPPEEIELSEKILVGLSFFLADDTEVDDLSAEWMRLINEVKTIRHKTNPEKYYQVQYWSENQELGGFSIFTGIEVTQIEEINPLFVIKTIPKGKYLRFIHKGLSNKVGYTYKYIYNQFLPDTNYRLTKPFNFEYYGPQFKGPYNENSESEIFIPIE